MALRRLDAHFGAAIPLLQCGVFSSWFQGLSNVDKAFHNSGRLGFSTTPMREGTARD